MATLLDQSTVDRLGGIIQRNAQGYMDLMRGVLFAGTPPGLEVLDTPDKRHAFERMLLRDATKEQRGQIPGDLNTTALENPAVRQMVEEDANATG